MIKQVSNLPFDEQQPIMDKMAAEWAKWRQTHGFPPVPPVDTSYCHHPKEQFVTEEDGTCWCPECSEP
jgi:hypothetical protein